MLNQSLLNSAEKWQVARQEMLISDFLINTVFACFVARALIFFNQTHYQALIQTGPYSSTGACYFQSKIMYKNYRWRQIFHDINPFSMSIYSRQTQIIYV